MSNNVSHRLPLRQLFIYLVLVLVIAAIGVLVYVFRPQPQKPRPAPSPGNFGSLALVKVALEAPASKDSALDQTTVRTDFRTGDRLHGRTFHFGDRATDPTFTFNSGLSYSYRSTDGRPNSEHRSAKGDISIPPNAFVEFEPSPTFAIEHPTLFRYFKPDDIDALRFIFSELLDLDSASADEAMTYVSGMRELKKLSFQSLPITAQGLANLKLDSMRSLTSLLLYQTLVDGNDLSRFKILPQLKTLAFSGKNATSVIKTVRSSKELRSLILMDAHLTDIDLKLIIECPLLKVLDIRLNPALTVVAVRYLLKQKGLQFLELDGDPSFLPVLSSMDQLRVLVLDSGHWSDRQKEKLRRSLPHCQVLFAAPGERIVVSPAQLP